MSTAIDTAIVGGNVAFIPTLTPTIMLVPWPVVLASEILWTGLDMNERRMQEVRRGMVRLGIRYNTQTTSNPPVCIVCKVLSRENNDVRAYHTDNATEKELEGGSRVFWKVQQPVRNDVESDNRQDHGYAVPSLKSFHWIGVGVVSSRAHKINANTRNKNVHGVHNERKENKLCCVIVVHFRLIS